MLDNNRDRVISSEHFGKIPANLTHETTTYVTLACLYNISLDYDPAQHVLRENGLFLDLIALLDDPVLGQGDNSHVDLSSMLHHITGLLSFAVEAYDVEKSPDSVLKTLFRYVVHGDPTTEEIVSLRGAVVLHLKHDRFKRLLFDQDLFEKFLVSSLRSFGYTGVSRTQLPDAFALGTPTDDDDTEDIESTQMSLIAALRDLSSLQMFFERYPFGEPAIIGKCFSWLDSDNPNLQLISCCVLSNYARAKEQWAQSLVVAHNTHLRLVQLCAPGPDSRVALAALEFLLQLARHPGNRMRICKHEFLDMMSSIWLNAAADSGELIRTQYASVAVLLGLICDCPQAIQQLVAHRAIDTATASSSGPDSYLQSLLLCFVGSKDKKVKFEIAKVIVEISKTLARLVPASNRSQDDFVSASLDPEITWRECLSVNPAFATPVELLVSQTEDLGMQAQGYLTLVIVARQELGVVMVRDVILHRFVFEHLVYAVSKQSLSSPDGSPPPERVDPAQWAAIQRSVHENARCLLREIVERKVSTHRFFSWHDTEGVADLLYRIEQDIEWSSEWMEILSDLSHASFDDPSRLMARAMPLLMDGSSITKSGIHTE